MIDIRKFTRFKTEGESSSLQARTSGGRSRPPEGIISPTFAIRPARVVIADPRRVVLLGLTKIIQGDARLSLVGEALDMSSLWGAILTDGPEIAIVDWSMASQDLKTTIKLLDPVLHNTAPILLTEADNAWEKRALLRFGARAVVSKRAPAAELRHAICKAINII